MASFLHELLRTLSRKACQYYYTSLACAYLFWRWVGTGGAALKFKERQMPRKLVDNYNYKHITLPSGINMHYVEAGNESAPLIVMVHGFPEFWYSWRFQIEHFKDRYRVIAIDQRGYGGTSKPPNINDYSTSLLAMDLDDLIHALGYKSAVVIGHDWGGTVAWQHALHYPESVDRLVICNCPHPAAFATLLERNRMQKARSWYRTFFQSPRIPEAAVSADDFHVFEEGFWGRNGLTNKENMTKEDMEAWKYTFSQPDCLRSAINYYRCAFQYPDAKRKIGKCAPKTLILWGDADKYLITECASLSAQWCEDVTLDIIPGASHWLQQDEPKIVNAHIDEFLQKSEKSPIDFA